MHYAVPALNIVGGFLTPVLTASGPHVPNQLFNRRAPPRTAASAPKLPPVVRTGHTLVLSPRRAAAPVPTFTHVK